MAIVVDAPVYLARRIHPQAGAIIKVGRSTNIPKRCASLGARAIVTLPPGLEAALLACFAAHRVWVRNDDGWFPDDSPRPLLQATTEWFYETGSVAIFTTLALASRPNRVPTERDALAWLNQAISEGSRPIASQHPAANGPEECVPRPSLWKRDAVDGRTRRAAVEDESLRAHVPAVRQPKETSHA